MFGSTEGTKFFFKRCDFWAHDVFAVLKNSFHRILDARPDVILLSSKVDKLNRILNHYNSSR